MKPQMPVRAEEEHLKRRVLWAAFAVFLAATTVGYIGEKSSYSTSLATRQELLRESARIWFTLKPLLKDRQEPLPKPEPFTDYSTEPGGPEAFILAMGLMKGFPDQSFRPEGPLKRGEGLYILANMCHFVRDNALVKHNPIYRDPPFSDVAEGNWLYTPVRELWSIAALWDGGNARLDPEGILSCRELHRITTAIIDYFSSEMMILETKRDGFKLLTKGTTTELPMSGWVISWDGKTWLNIPEDGNIALPPNWNGGKLGFSHPLFREVEVDGLRLNADSFWLLRLKRKAGKGEQDLGIDYSARSPQWVRERLKEHLKALKERRSAPSQAMVAVATTSVTPTSTTSTVLDTPAAFVSSTISAGKPDQTPSMDLAPKDVPPDQPPVLHEATAPIEVVPEPEMIARKDFSDRIISPDDEALDSEIVSNGNARNFRDEIARKKAQWENEWEQITQASRSSRTSSTFPRAKTLALAKIADAPHSLPVSPGNPVEMKSLPVHPSTSLTTPFRARDRQPLKANPLLANPPPLAADASEKSDGEKETGGFELTGKIQDAATGRGLGNATFLAGKRNITLGADGLFTLRCQRDQMMELTAYCEGYETQVLKHRVGYKPGDLIITLNPSLAKFSGTVIDSLTGRGIGNASIRIGKVTALTKPNGSFIFPKIPPTYYQISCRADGYMDATEIAYVANPETRKVIKLMAMDSGLNLEGEVPAE